MAAIAVHGRTRSQGYSGEADWNVIDAVARAVLGAGSGRLLFVPGLHSPAARKAVVDCTTQELEQQVRPSRVCVTLTSLWVFGAAAAACMLSEVRRAFAAQAAR